jgi:F-type H+-transporting ATPase subunit gamma
MPSLIDLRRRIRAVKSTQQITKAMKMIAASRLKRAQDRVMAARPFATEALKVLNRLATSVDQDEHPLLRAPDPASGRALLIVITGDRGLCGSFNTNVLKAASQFIISEGRRRQVALELVGRKARDAFRRRGFEVLYETTGIFQRLTFDHAVEIGNVAIERFSSGEVSTVHMIYNEFKSVIAQKLVVEQLLPIPRLEPTAGPAVNYIYEPSAEDIFRDLLPRHVQLQIFRALLETNAAFFAAQMTAMDAATRNSAEMIENLTLYMNKVRQAGITREIIEVVSGAAAT